jgi:dolichol kinase
MIDKHELLRKIFHFSVLYIIPLDIVSHELAVYSILAFSIGYIFTFLLNIKKIKIPLFTKIIEFPSRKEETKNIFNPPLFLFLSTLVLITFLPGTPAYVGIISVAVGDNFAGILGSIFKSRRIFKKTIVGSLGFFFSTLIALSFLIPLQYAALFAIIGTILELISHKYDNLIVPFVISGLAFVIL